MRPSRLSSILLLATLQQVDAAHFYSERRTLMVRQLCGALSLPRDDQQLLSADMWDCMTRLSDLQGQPGVRLPYISTRPNRTNIAVGSEELARIRLRSRRGLRCPSAIRPPLDPSKRQRP